MDDPSKRDIEYLIDAAETISTDNDIPEYISYRLLRYAQQRLKWFGPDENAARLHDRISQGFVLLEEDQECPKKYEKMSLIEILVDIYGEYYDAKNENDGVEGSSETRERFLTTSKVLRTALRMLIRVERGDTSEEDFIRENRIPEEIVQNTKYDEDSYNESSSTAAATDLQASRVNTELRRSYGFQANMNFPSKIEIEYLIDAAEKASFERDIEEYIPYRLFEEARETLERFKNDQTSLIGHAENTADLEDRIDKGLKRLTYEGKKIPECPEGYTENESVIQVLVKFYRRYNKKKKIDKLHNEDENHKKWGFLSRNFQVLEGRSAMRERILTTSKALRIALKMLCRVERGDTSEEVFIQENEIPNEFLQDTEYDEEGSNETYNIIPFDDRPDLLPEVKRAIASLKWGIEDFPPRTRGHDVLDCLQKCFGFQESSVSNQRENIVNLLSNEQMRPFTPGEHGTALEAALEKVFSRTLDNYTKWCSYLSIKSIWENTDENATGEDENVISKDKKILNISLYYLIWGEAANVRFLPECLCYIFHRMSEQLDKYLKLNGGSSIEQVPQPLYEGSFIDQVIQPLYEVIAAEAKIKKEMNVPHSKWRNYDDFNEYFWSRDCLQLGWPLERNSPFFRKPLKGSTVFGKTSFVEHRTFWHLYHSFHRMWIFHVMMFQALVIFAFNDEKLNTKTLRGILTVGPTYFVMKLFQSMFDIGLKYGAYSNTSDSKKSHLLFRFIWFIVATAFICFLCMKCLQEMTSSIEESMGFIIYITILGIYAVFKILFSYLSKKYENSSVAGLISWIYQEEYVGRGMDEKPTDYKYMIFWLVTLAINISYTYHYLISPLVRPTRDITDVSKNIHNMLAIGSLWAGVICAYIVGSHVSYNVTSAVVGTFVGHKDGLGNIKFLGDVHKCFDKIPTAFMNHSRESPLENNQEDVINRESCPENNQEDVKKLDAAEFSPFWNQIVMNLREEDYISDSEQYALSMPEKSGCIDVIQWPFFLLAGKVSLAIKIAAKPISQEDMWDEISRDAYMKYAVEECFHSVKFILKSVSDNEGRAWVEGIYEDIESSIARFQLKQLESFVKAISELTEMLNMQKDLNNVVIQDAKRLKNNAKKLLNNVIQHNFLGKAGSQISDVNWPTDPELWSQIERLHLLLTMDKSAHRVPRNPEARRRLEFFTNSLFMSMPKPKPVRKMLSFSVLTPYYEETVLYSLDELQSHNDDGVTLIDYLKNLYPDEWTNYCERHEGYTDVEGDEYELRLWASYRGQTLARTVRGTMYYQKALLLQAYREMLIAVGLGEDGLTSTSPVLDVSMDEATLNSLEELSSRGEILKHTFRIILRDEENYNPWKEKMMEMLESQKTTGFVDPKGESQVKYVRNYSQKWKKLDKKVKDWIMASLNDTLKNMVKEMKTAKELWETLKIFFTPDTNGIPSVPIKLLNKDNYREWVSQMENFLQAKGMFGYINGKLKHPDPKGKSTLTSVIEYSRRWKELDRQVREWIIDSLSESMYDSVKDSETAEQMRDALKEIIRSQCLDSAKAHVDLKFTYVVSCQIYGEQKRKGKDMAADIAFLLKRNEGLRVAYIDENEENNKKEFYSKLVKADKNGKETEVYSIKLPGDPRLGEGKPENQNHAIVFTRGNAIQTIDMNQDNYFEETLKMRNLLEEFHRKDVIPPPTILGIREHIFTGSASYLASFMSNQETSFVTLGQRVMAKPLNVRMHYGHSDVFDRVFHITRGGISKASRGINISEDIYAGFNSTLRKGRVTHHEYIQVGKGRDVGFNQIAIFEGKVAGGNGEQVLSRDIYRLGQRFDFFRMLSFYYTSVGYYFSSLLMVITLYILLYGNLIMALSGTRVPHVLNDTNLTIWWLLLIVLLPAIYMVLVQYIEQGLEKAVECFLAMFFKLCSIFFAFSLGTRIHWFGRTIIHGGASYQATGRGFVLHHITFSENYRLYSRSHFVKGMEVLFLSVVYCIYGFHPAHAIYNNLLLLGGLILSISWIVAPFLFDSSPFDLDKNLEDWEDWNNWRNCKSVPVEESVAVEEHVPVDETVRAKKSVPVEEHVPVKQSVAVEEHVPVKQSVAVEEHAPIEESVTVEKSWEAWWNKELSHIRTFEGRVIETILSLRFFIFPYVVGYKLDMQGLWICGQFWICFMAINEVLSMNPSVTIGALVIAFCTSHVGDLLAFIIAFITTLWGILSICVAWKPMLKRFNYLWKLVKSLAWICDAGMGTLIFSIAPMLSRRTIKQYLVRNMSDQNVSEYLQTTPAETAILYGRAF